MLSPISNVDLIRASYKDLFYKLRLIKPIRNKLSHGQVTTERDSRADLENWIFAMMDWTKALANAADMHFGNDGYSFILSYTKHPDPAFHTTLKHRLTSVRDYIELISKAHGESLKHSNSL